MSKVVKDLCNLWVHKPGIACKMDGAWDGPFQVKKQISPVNIEVILPGKTKPKVLHANLIKPYFAPTSVIHRVAVIREEDDDTMMVQGRMILTDGGRLPTEQEKHQLAGVLDKHRENLCKEPGCTKEIMMSILLEDSQPFTLRPYTGIIALLKSTGIIVATMAPWASPIVTVVKKDSSIRMCVDCRSLNSKTVADPYQMPRVEDYWIHYRRWNISPRSTSTRDITRFPSRKMTNQKQLFLLPPGEVYVFKDAIWTKKCSSSIPALDGPVPTSPQVMCSSIHR